jgi:hypothetical protein
VVIETLFGHHRLLITEIGTTKKTSMASMFFWEKFCCKENRWKSLRKFGVLHVNSINFLIFWLNFIIISTPKKMKKKTTKDPFSLKILFQMNIY